MTTINKMKDLVCLLVVGVLCNFLVACSPAPAWAYPPKSMQDLSHTNGASSHCFNVGCTDTGLSSQ